MHIQFPYAHQKSCETLVIAVENFSKYFLHEFYVSFLFC